jgi:hypothetical protein
VTPKGSYHPHEAWGITFFCVTIFCHLVNFVLQKKNQIFFSKVVRKNKFNTMMFDLMEILIFLVKKKRNFFFISSKLKFKCKNDRTWLKPSSN